MNGFVPSLTVEQRQQRAKQHNKKRANEYAFLIEGEYLNYRQLADRLGVSRDVATRRHKAALPPITWEKLQCSTHQTNGAG